MKIVINKCFGGFGLSDKAYEKLIEWGVPVKKYIAEKRDTETGRYKPEPLNDGEVIFDRELTPVGECTINDTYHKYKNKSRIQTRYWDTWTRGARTHPLIIRLVEELGDEANGFAASLKVIEVPDGVEWEISEYDGNEHVAEKHRTWT